MIMLRNGMSYLLMRGIVWLDDSTQVTLQEWIDADDPLCLVWRQGQRSSGWVA